MSELVKYIRTKKDRIPRGVLVAVQMDNRVGIGYSLCNKKDSVNKEKGKKLAIVRAGAFLDKNPMLKQHPIPETIQKALPHFIERARKYYADKQFPEWTNAIV